VAVQRADVHQTGATAGKLNSNVRIFAAVLIMMIFAITSQLMNLMMILMTETWNTRVMRATAWLIAELQPPGC